VQARRTDKTSRAERRLFPVNPKVLMLLIRGVPRMASGTKDASGIQRSARPLGEEGEGNAQNPDAGASREGDGLAV
jgi:hypothetical protein